MAVTKPTLAFVDHSFHKHTHSGDFLRELLAEHFTITDYWDESWQGGATVPPEEINKHDHVFYFQVLNPVSELKRIRVPITWTPMYDGVKFDQAYWKLLACFPIRILSFSKKLSAWCIEMGLPTHALQYYMEPLPPPNMSGNHFFFWDRGGIKVSRILDLIPPEQVDGFTCIRNADPGKTHEPIPADIAHAYHMQVLETGFLPQPEYRKLVDQANIFISPRKKEGIGMSFIEALARGCVVVGYNDSTLNEYVTNGVDGYVFDEKTRVLDFADIRAIRLTSQQRAQSGYERWVRESQSIYPFITETSPLPSKRTRLYREGAYRFARTVRLVAAFAATIRKHL